MNSASPLGEAKTVARAMNSNRVVAMKVVATVLMMIGCGLLTASLSGYRELRRLLRLGHGSG
jgi:hypothetical protein